MVVVALCFCYQNLYNVNGILKTEDHPRIFQHKLKPSDRRNLSQNLVFQQDNDPKHTSKMVVEQIERCSLLEPEPYRTSVDHA